MKVGLGRTLLDWLLYVAWRNVQAFLQALPWRTGQALARQLGSLAYVLDRPKRKRRALANLRRAFPSLGRRQAKRILKGVYRHLGETVLDGLNFAHFAGRRDPQELCETVGFERLAGVPRRTGLIFVTGHFGHWEVLGSASPMLGYPVWSVGRSSHNPFVERYVRELRETTGQHMLGKRGVVRRVIRLLRQGEHVAFLIDQDARGEGIFVDFFGRPASTSPSVARIALYTGAPVAFAYARKIRRQNRFRLVLKDVILPRQGGDAQAEVHRITQRLTRDLEEEVRRAPQEWLWLHRRWKTRPGMYEPTEKAVILARGLGTRMQREQPGVALGQDREELAGQGLKALVPVAGRPFLDHVVDSLARAGLRRICLVVAPDADALREHARRIETAAGVSIECAVQAEPLGTADAVLAAEAFVADDAFVLVNGDDLYPAEVLRKLVALSGRNCWLAAFDRDQLVRHGNIAPERVKDFAVVAASNGGRLLGIVEKPSEPEQYAKDGRLWLSMNLYRFTPDIFESCRRIRPDPRRGELELTAAVADLVASGKTRFEVLFCEGGVLDLTSREDVLAAEQALKERQLCF